MEELLKHMEWVYVGLLLIMLVSFLLFLRRFNAKNSQKAVVCGNCQNASECEGPQEKLCFLDTIEEDSALDPKE